MDKLKKELIEISKNLMIDFSKEDIENIANELKDSIALLDEIHKIDLSKVNPTNFLNINTPNDFREDIVEDFPNKKELLDNAKDVVNGFVKV
ncbi:MAG: aspartyl/glutamyl-tRNA amidotransferase subunit C [Malacoplasma sp.]